MTESACADERSFNGMNGDELDDEPREHITRLMSRRSSRISGQEKDELDPDVVRRVESIAESLKSRKAKDGPQQMDADQEFDAEAIFKLFVRDAKDQGIHIRKAGVIAENVTVTAPDLSSAEGKTFGDILMLPKTIAKGIRQARNTKLRDIVSDVNLLARPGEMVLVLGRPGAGCSTILKTVACEIKSYKEVRGSISYDGVSQKDMIKKYKRDCIYNGEMDVHFPHLTVQQTLDFALSCSIPRTRVNGVKRSEYIVAMRELYSTIFGLRHTYNTKVGNDYVRGVSGGERKRVSIAEALAARGTIYCWDNATRGLDASTALEYAQAIRIMTNLLKSVALVTIYQASENIYETFDRVSLLYDGKQIYFGSTSDARAYFEKLGYKCPSRQSTAEFLTAVTDPNGLHEYLPGFEHSAPRTASEFEKAWKNSEEFSNLLQEISDYKQQISAEKTEALFDESLAQERSKYAYSKSKFTISYAEQVRLCTKRGFQRIYGDMSYTITNTAAAIIQSLVTGSLYYNLPSSTNGAFSRGGVFYFAILYSSLMGLANINLDSRPIVQKHNVYSLYSPSAEALASSLSAFPFRALSLTCFFIILFFLSGLTRDAGRFFISYLFLMMCAESINGLFEMITAAADTIAQANAVSGVLMMALVMYSTYMIQLEFMHPWFKWIAYCLPIRYTFESMLNAEFHNRKMACGGSLVPSGPGYQNVSAANQVCAFVGSRPGQSWVLGDDYINEQFEYRYTHVWRNLGFMFAFVSFYLFAKAVFTEFKSTMKTGGDTLVYKKGTRMIGAIQDEEGATGSDSSSDVKRKEGSSPSYNSNSSNMFEGLKSKGVFTWKDVCYTIPYKGGSRRLLDEVSGYCVPGTLTALMGESGAGKTTLLNTLAQRNIGIITGDMLVNGRPIDASFERRTGYVQQQDLHVKEMTVRESLQFAARMRRPQTVPEEEKMSYVERILEILDMEEYADALVGDIGYGLNVEQLKKVSIGVELAAKPDLLLFLDEPTSGLDSQSAWAVVQVLRKLAEAGQSILCTIHQPSATLFEEFDRLLLLKKGGQTVYFGPIGDHSRTLLNYFERNGARKCDETENPAEYILESIGAGATASVKEDWHAIWKSSAEFKTANEEIDKLLAENSTAEVGDYSHGEGESEKVSKYATSYWYQFKCVWQRTATVFWRDVNYLMSKFMLFTVGGLFVGFTFYDVGTSFTGLQNSMFAAFIAIVLSAPAMNQIQARAIASRELFEVRESKSNTFHWAFLLIAQYLSEIPYHFFFSTVFFVSFYFPLRTNFEASKSGVFFLNYCITFQLYLVGLGLTVLYMAPNLPSGNVLLSLCLSFLISFCGVVQPASLMPGFWTFMWKVSPYTYFVQNLVGLMLHDKPVRCKKRELSYFNPPAGETCGSYLKNFLDHATGYVANPNDTENCGYCVYKVGDEYLTRMGSSFSNLWRNFGFFWAYIGFNICAMLVAYYVFHVSNFSVFDLGFIKKAKARFSKE
ncbi:LAMI_0F13146g1_1 [Lachancea mirantina]|uniref:LAMI_0F13146g1_1 n=1 Tax=Lachancea mirantina TaxID=1230905 RepID=A0A1G4K376_9SACH|nr:LAMI_0F13146g1_1 [Lachancea mirantina]